MLGTGCGYCQSQQSNVAVNAIGTAASASTFILSGLSLSTLLLSKFHFDVATAVSTYC